MSRHFPRCLGAALLIGVPCGGSVPLFAHGARPDPPASQLAASPRPRLLRLGDGSLEVQGAPGRRLLLLFGELESNVGESGRRVRPVHVTELELDAGGTTTLQGLGIAARTFVQAWQPGSASQGPWGAFSAPVTLLPGGSLASAAHAGDLVVTEFMKDPTVVSDTHGEWIELYCTSAWRLDIEGVTLSDFSGASFTLDNGGNGILLAPGQRFVLGNDDDPLTYGGVPVDWKWTGFSLKNTADEIVLTSSAGTYLDVVTYDDGVRWPDVPGMSITLTAPIGDSFLNDEPGMWCSSSSLIGAGPDTGTPGAPNEFCP